MSFLYLLLIVLGITSVAYLAKLSAKGGVSSFDLTFVMFAAASVLGYFFAIFNHVATASYTVELCSISAMAGIGGGLAVFVFNKSVRIGHFGYSNAIYRSSFLIPVIFSVAFFGAILNFVTVAGILCILTSIVLVSWSNEAFAADRKSGNLLWFFMIIGAFGLSGLPRIGQLLISHQNLNSFAYLFMSYAVGFILLLLLFLIRRKRVKARALLYGILAAFASYVGVYCTLEALKLMPAAVVFPVTLSAPIMLGMFISFMYREKIRLVGWIGVVVGIGGITMLSLQTYAK
ncbi:MAG: EamA family transporter [Smithellaceae bacterium]|nr:EamA family transporter [Smithellaceae bacterium]NLX51712.1 EamA family transporter [Deltaproteobacteria bacterium]